jgi:hypothetical protein
MLTEQQLKQLKPLTKHKKFGKVLKAAIIGWKKCRPIAGYFGICVKNGSWRRQEDTKGCCLIGASLLNRKNKDKSYGCKTNDVMQRFDLSWSDHWGLSDGWENTPFSDPNSEGYIFGKKVREILQPIIDN